MEKAEQAKKTKAVQDILDQRTLREVQKYKDFASIWNNDRRFPAMYDLERRFNKTGKAIQAEARKWRAFAKTHPKLKLGFLISRQPDRGGILDIPESIMAQLDVFRYEKEKFIKDAKKAGGFVVTSAQFGAPLNKWVWNSLNQYSKHTGLPIAVLPIRYGKIETWHDEESGELLTSSFPDELKNHVLLEIVTLCGGEIQLNPARFRPTLQKILTDSVSSFGDDATLIVAGPALELTRLPRIGRREAKAAMTTGAVTHPNYARDKLGQQDRTGEIAAQNHTYAAIVVEFDRGAFHFRQLHSNKRGMFYDINPEHCGATLFTPDGVEYKPKAVSGLVTGDWHTGKTDPKVRKGTFGDGGMVHKLRVQEGVVMHDLIDADSISHFDSKDAIRKSYKAKPNKAWNNLQKELDEAVKEIRWIHKQTTKNVPGAQVVVVPSNHDERIGKYIRMLDFINDDTNRVFGMELFIMSFKDMEKRNPTKEQASGTEPHTLYFRRMTPEVIMLERKKYFSIPRGRKNSILVSIHGDQGLKGQRAAGTREFQKLNRRIVLGHIHSAMISGRIWRVGTSTAKTDHYVPNPATDWSQTHCVIFENGQRMLLNFIKGRWHGQRLNMRNLKEKK